MHDFAESLQRGHDGEAVVSAHLREHGCIVSGVGMDQQRQGVDFLVRLPTGLAIRAEVKTDLRCCLPSPGHPHGTRRVAFETVSNDGTGKLGWVYTCQADWVLYYLPGDELLYWLRPSILRATLPEWERAARLRKPDFRPFTARNGSYSTLGVLVPQYELERIAELVHDVSEVARGR